MSSPLGANNGTCAQVVSCGNATTLEACGTTIHDNNIHDCRAASSPYDSSAQGVLLGGAVAAQVCTVGVVVKNNNINRVDSFGIRVSNDNYYPCVDNQIVFNAVREWGQCKTLGKPSTDAACMYMCESLSNQHPHLRTRSCIARDVVGGTHDSGAGPAQTAIGSRWATTLVSTSASRSTRAGARMGCILMTLQLGRPSLGIYHWEYTIGNICHVPDMNPRITRSCIVD